MPEDFTAASFYRHLAEGRLMGSRCRACNALHLPPRPVCGQCGSRDMLWEQLQGRGKLAAFTVIAVAPSPMLKEGFDRRHPYCTGVVEMEEGPRISARVLGVDVAKPASIDIGTPLTLEVLLDEAGKPKPVVAFRVAA